MITLGAFDIFSQLVWWIGSILAAVNAWHTYRSRSTRIDISIMRHNSSRGGLLPVMVSIVNRNPDRPARIARVQLTGIRTQEGDWITISSAPDEIRPAATLPYVLLSDAAISVVFSEGDAAIADIYKTIRAEVITENGQRFLSKEAHPSGPQFQMPV